MSLIIWRSALAVVARTPALAQSLPAIWSDGRLDDPAVAPVQAVFVIVESTVGPERVMISSVVVPPGTTVGLVCGAEIVPDPVVWQVTTLPETAQDQPGVIVET
jgi:hypothetical protein